MSEIVHKFVHTNGIRMHVAEAGAGFPVLMCHGFPELWYSWRHQIKALADAGFRAIAPDQRGYGETDAPAALEAYTQRHLVDDLTGMLDALGVDKCVIIGHDWGGAVAWNAAMMAPDRIARVIGLNTPFFARAPLKPTDLMRMIAQGNFHYMLYFQEPGVAEAELERDVARSLRGFYQEPTGDGALSAVSSAPPGVWGPAGGGILDRLPDRTHGKFLTDDDFAVFVRAFTRTGFRGGLNWYRNIDRSWEQSAGLVQRVDQPALMITAELDPVLRPELANGMEQWVPNLKRANIKGSGHWTQQEKPAEVNAAILAFLTDLKK
jgi:epoxide hydrolase A/B